MKKLLLLALLIFALNTYAQPSISFTFDDGSTADRPGYDFKTWNDLLLKNLADANIKAAFLVTGNNKQNKKGLHLLKTWSDEGHLIGNHTFTHPNYNGDISFEKFSEEILKNDVFIKDYPGYAKLFRFPYLKEGNSKEKVEKIRKFLKDNGYKNAHVTIDASDWYVDSRLVQALRKNITTDLEAFKDYYLTHLWERAQFYEKLSYEINGRHIKHTVLLHHNLAAALFLDDLIAMFKEKGWVIVDAKEAFEDPIFNHTPTFAGESLIYAMAKDLGNYELRLRKPGEDSRYEKAKMDKLGL